MSRTRRAFLSAGTLAGLSAVTRNATSQIGVATMPGAMLGDDSLAPGSQAFLPLWPGLPPGAGGSRLDMAVPHQVLQRPQQAPVVTKIAKPGLSVYQAARPDGSAMLLISGGGYAYITTGQEVARVAQWLAERGTTVFVLLHRLPQDGWAVGADAPLQDAQRAMRLIRAGASQWQVDPRRIGVMGASAGGHVAGQLLTRHDALIAALGTPSDNVSARPDFACLLYPVVTMQGEATHAGSRKRLLGDTPGADQLRLHSNEQQVHTGMPPTFLLHAADDASVPVANSLLFFSALRQVRVDTAMHVFHSGGHGFGLTSTSGPTVGAWPELFHAWGISQRLLS